MTLESDLCLRIPCENRPEPIIETGGSLYVNDQNWHSQLSDAILQGVTEISHSLQNINKASQTGFMKAQMTIKNGERWSTDRLIYKNNNERLKILTNSFVTKVLFKSNKAVGIQFVKNYKIYQAFARKGVIVSAGAIGTPKLLMLSGIGPKQHLKEHNIETIVDLPVGEHLMDHVITGLDLVTLNSSVELRLADVINPYSAIKYYLFGRGPWTSGGIDVVGTFYSKFNKNQSSAPDLQIMTFPLGLSQDNGMLLRKNLRIPDDIFNEYFRPLTFKTAITIAPVLLHPKSTGEIKLRSANPFDAPVIDPKYLSNEEDVLKLIDGIEFIKKLIETKAMQEFGAELYKKPFPGCETFVFDTIEYWTCYVRHLTFSTYHPGGTCRMGAVVDSEFRVYKTENLFVVDASVFPKLPSGNTNAPVIMLSEKAARLFVENFKRNPGGLHKCYRSDVFLLLNQCY